MPFALPEYEHAYLVFVNQAVRELARARDPVLSQMQFAAASTTVGSRLRDGAGVDVDLEPSKVGFEMSTPVVGVRDADLPAFYVEIDEAAEMLANELMRVWFESMDKLTSATGNVVDAGGRLTFDALYELLEKLDYELDENDELVMPSLVMHPDQADQLQALGPPTPEQNAKLAALRERKKEEARARRRRRRLS